MITGEGPVVSPESLGGARLVVSPKAVQPDKKWVGAGFVTDHKSNRGVNESGHFVVRTDPDAVAAIHMIFPPEGKTLLGIYIPFGNPGLV